MNWKEVVLDIFKGVGIFAKTHPLISVVALMIFLIFVMLISHLYDIVEGNARHKLLWGAFLIFLVLAIVILLVAFDAGTLAWPW